MKQITKRHLQYAALFMMVVCIVAMVSWFWTVYDIIQWAGGQ